MAGREPWSRYPGEDVEAVVAIMLLLQYRHGRRIRPSRGDGGVDVLIPHAGNQWEVYQVKSFTTSLTSSHKQQITKSWNRLRAYTKERGIRVVAWHVVRLIDPTHEDDIWLANLTAGSNIPSDWIGLATIEGWASKYPEVLDYYLHGGRDYVLDQVRSFLTAANLDQALESGRLVEPMRALGGLLALSKTLNTLDPHYQYHLSTLPVLTDGRFSAPRDIFGLIYSVTLDDGTSAARLDIVARYDEAAEDRPAPAPLKLQVSLQPSTEAQRTALEGFFAYGTPIEDIPVEVTGGTLPDIFASEPSAATSLTIMEPRGDDWPQSYELEAIDSTGNQLAVLPLSMTAPTYGIDGTGRWAWNGSNPTGVVSFAMLQDPASDTTTLKIKSGDVTGATPRDVLTALTALSTMRAGATLQLRLPDGPTIYRISTLPHDVADIEHVEFWINICRDLLTLQRHIPSHLRIPNVSSITSEDVNGWREAATLLTGVPVWKNWTSLGPVRIDGEDLNLPRLVRMTQQLCVRVGSDKWNVGYVDKVGIAGNWNPTLENGRAGILTPAEDTRVRITIADDDGAAQRALAALPQLGPEGLLSLE